MRESCTVIAAEDQRMTEDAMADKVAIARPTGSWWGARDRPQ